MFVKMYRLNLLLNQYTSLFISILMKQYFLLIIMLVVLKNTAALSPRRAFILKYRISGRQARPSLGLLWIESYEA